MTRRREDSLSHARSSRCGALADVVLASYLVRGASTTTPGYLKKTPPPRLAGFSQVTLRPGQVTRVSISIDPGSAQHPLSYWSTASNSWATLPGQYQVQVGSSAQDLPLTAPVLVG